MSYLYTVHRIFPPLRDPWTQDPPNLLFHYRTQETGKDKGPASVMAGLGTQQARAGLGGTGPRDLVPSTGKLEPVGWQI